MAQRSRRFPANAVRLQLHALAYNLANFLRTLALPAEVAQWSMTTLRERLVKIGAKIVRHGRSITFQMAEVMVPRYLFQEILDAIAALMEEDPVLLRDRTPEQIRMLVEQGFLEPLAAGA